mgnify:CR=1 FL=1|tara:strand:- start:3097 stop:3375 length:279 start_codon:yes stop_codon:yes gene_type:complete
MIKTLMYHKVEDFTKWKEAFDKFYDFRKSSGEISFSVGTLFNESNTAYVINEWNSIENFNAFVSSSRLSDAMKDAGVLEPPHSLILEELAKG